MDFIFTNLCFLLSGVFSATLPFVKWVLVHWLLHILPPHSYILSHLLWSPDLSWLLYPPCYPNFSSYHYPPEFSWFEGKHWKTHCNFRIKNKYWPSLLKVWALIEINLLCKELLKYKSKKNLKQTVVLIWLFLANLCVYVENAPKQERMLHLLNKQTRPSMITRPSSENFITSKMWKDLITRKYSAGEFICFMKVNLPAYTYNWHLSRINVGNLTHIKFNDVIIDVVEWNSIYFYESRT